MKDLSVIIDEINLHKKRIEAILPDIKKWQPFKVKDFENIEKTKTIDSFIFRFTKIQDIIGDKFFPATLERLQEYKEKMPFIDILGKLEKLELIPSRDEWIDFRKLRNSLTHEYPDTEEEIIEAINMSIDVYEKISTIYNNILDYFKKSSD